MRVAIIEDGKIVNIIEATSVEHAQKFYPGARAWEPGDTIEPSGPPDPDAALRAQYEAEQQAKQAAEFEAFKARSGEPSYKAAAVKIAAEKLALTALIEAALDTLINADGDKALLVWWTETDAISRGDVQWQRIEGAVEWPKGVSATDLFELAAQV